jgi:hypothetical protein
MVAQAWRPSPALVPYPEHIDICKIYSISDNVQRAVRNCHKKTRYSMALREVETPKRATVEYRKGLFTLQNFEQISKNVK